MTVADDDLTSDASHRYSIDSGAEVGEEEGSRMDESGVEGGDESPRLLQLLTFTPDSLNFVGKRVSEKTRDKYIQIGRQYDLSFKMVRSETKLVKTILYSYGFTQVSARNPNFNVLWTSTHLKAHCLRSLKSWQRVNHFPRSGELTRKDRLYENIARSKAIFGSSPGGPFSFIPEFYVTPRDMDRLQRVMEDRRNRSSSSSAAQFIVKPVSGSRGRGIFFANKPDEIPLASPLLVSRYLSSPLTVNDHKFDLRVYVAVTSFYPLVAYVYTEGLTRLASEKYSRSAKEDDEFVHLTNYSVNKNSKNFVRNETLEAEDYGHKWTLGALLRHLEERGIDQKLMMLRIEDIITKSLLSVQNTVSAACRSVVMHPNVCFELFGFDILIDSDLKPWLLEVNLSPSLTCDAPLDSLVKTKLICDLFNLTGVQLISKKAMRAATAAAAASASDTKTSDVEMATRDFPEGCCSSPSSSGISSASSSVGGNSKSKRKLTRRVDAKLAAAAAASAARAKKAKSVRAFAKKVEEEEKRRGDFIRIFPRKHTQEIYGSLMEDVGGERWDARLYEQLFPTEASTTLTDTAQDTVARLHNELIDTKRYPSFESLSPSVARLLSHSYEAAGEYAQTMSKQHGGVYVSAALPSVRLSARARTKSCVEWYESRQNDNRGALGDLTDGKVQVLDGKENKLPSLSSASSSPVHHAVASPLRLPRDERSMKDTVENITSVAK